jgi:hypothetical protein
MTRSRPITILASAAAVLLAALAVTSCGGSSSNSSASNSPSPAPVAQTPPPVAKTPPQVAKKAAPAPTTTPAPQASSSNGIPQGNVADNDADNHGGPDDGDGAM